MTVLKLILGIVILLLSIATVIASVARTPSNLRGFYGKMFIVIAFTGVLGGSALVVFAFLG